MGTSGVLMLGDPGVGKSALLDYAFKAAVGFRVVEEWIATRPAAQKEEIAHVASGP